ncbi:hypothetical protein HELRODRAFT_94141 [Helobdella robusta]|uniref:Tetratricopeptide repeat protein 38 n=1 Tax=Helobdella robusta TaxID=6412 RepID=T1G8Z1_HELRO|nr:hypothetical protein HELRODRAFT_94141 [Helobdella robusta]ESO06595.1 hypothetical protein HELRODRAFT_94141 [Helobdella robusta]
MGHVLLNSIQFLGTTSNPLTNKEFRESLDLTYRLAIENVNLSEREKLHVDALRKLDEGFMGKASTIWERILQSHPTDPLALKLAAESYFYLGYKRDLKGSIERVQDKWSPQVPYWHFLFGMKAFGCCENEEYEEAERLAKEGLKHLRNDIWSTHALAHVYEMIGQFNLGAKFLDETVDDWQSCNLMSCHVHWHNAVFNIERGDHGRALAIYDAKIGPRIQEDPDNMLNVVDACSILYRLMLEGVDLKDRFCGLISTCENHANDHVYTFNDLHFLMVFLGSGHRVKARQFVQSIEDYLSTQPHANEYTMTSRLVGLKLSRAMLAYHEGFYEEAVELFREMMKEIQEGKFGKGREGLEKEMGPKEAKSGEGLFGAFQPSIKRDLVVVIGGSDAQRDVFAQFCIHASMNSKKPEHQSLARDLLQQRKIIKPISPLTDRLMAKLQSCTRDR